jgi:polyisoprenoid-binding protein YceI
MRSVKWIAGLVVAALVLVVGGTWVYLNVIKDDAPAPLALTDDERAADAAEEPAGLDGTWTAAAGSTVGYRVKEVLFGQDAEAVGRTEDVTGSVTVAGSTVTDASFEVDMTTVKSDEDRRDGQFHGRIMDTAQFPTATFTLTEPAELSEPGAGAVVQATANGILHLRGTSKPVSIELQARQAGDTFEVHGVVPIAFADWGIPNPSNVAASVGDEGLLELLLVLTKG